VLQYSYNVPYLTFAQTLEDVDYTVLAASRVLRNLSDKCPPAEACRDAFERMSKATIKMCQSASGFASRAPMLVFPRTASLASARQSPPQQKQPQPQQQQPPPPPSASYNPASPPEGTIPLYQTQQTLYQTPDSMGRFRPQRPRPQFDMNLRDLFPDESPESHNFRQGITQMQAPAMPNRTNYGAATTPSPLDSFSSPSASISGLPIAATPESLASYPSNNPYASTYSGSNPLTNSVDPTDPMFPSSLSNDLDALIGDSTGAFNGDNGLSLGFDTEHDWNDGAPPDLFDGFWFGGWNGGGLGAFGTTGDGGIMDMGADRPESMEGPMGETDNDGY
jgi:hypothetical protein